MLADVVEALAGAVFIDGGNKTEKVWKVFEPLLRDFLTRLAAPDTIKTHPLAFLNLHAMKKRKELEIDWIVDGEVVDANDCVNEALHTCRIKLDGVVLSEVTSESRKAARLEAASEAMQKVQMESEEGKAPAEADVDNVSVIVEASEMEPPMESKVTGTLHLPSDETVGTQKAPREAAEEEKSSTDMAMHNEVQATAVPNLEVAPEATQTAQSNENSTEHAVVGPDIDTIRTDVDEKIAVEGQSEAAIIATEAVQDALQKGGVQMPE